MHSQNIRKSFKQKIKKTFMVGLILTESIIMSCEKHNNIEGERKMVQKEIIEENKIEKDGRTFHLMNNSNNFYYNMKNQSFKDNLKRPILIIYNPKTNKKYEIESNGISSITFEHKNSIYNLKIIGNRLDIKKYNISELKENIINTPTKFTKKINGSVLDTILLLRIEKNENGTVKLKGEKLKKDKMESFSIELDLSEIGNEKMIPKKI